MLLIDVDWLFCMTSHIRSLPATVIKSKWNKFLFRLMVWKKNSPACLKTFMTCKILENLKCFKRLYLWVFSAKLAVTYLRKGVKDMGCNWSLLIILLFSLLHYLLTHHYAEFSWLPVLQLWSNNVEFIFTMSHI